MSCELNRETEEDHSLFHPSTLHCLSIMVRVKHRGSILILSAIIVCLHLFKMPAEGRRRCSVSASASRSPFLGNNADAPVSQRILETARTHLAFGNNKYFPAFGTNARLLLQPTATVACESHESRSAAKYSDDWARGSREARRKYSDRRGRGCR